MEMGAIKDPRLIIYYYDNKIKGYQRRQKIVVLYIKECGFKNNEYLLSSR